MDCNQIKQELINASEIINAAQNNSVQNTPEFNRLGNIQEKITSALTGLDNNCGCPVNPIVSSPVIYSRPVFYRTSPIVYRRGFGY